MNENAIELLSIFSLSTYHIDLVNLTDAQRVDHSANTIFADIFEHAGDHQCVDVYLKTIHFVDKTYVCLYLDTVNV